MTISEKKNSGTWQDFADSEAKPLTLLWNKRQKWLKGQIAEINPWYERLGPVGRSFKYAFENAACVEEIDTVIPKLAKNTRAVMNSHNIFDGFMNGIVIGRAALEDKNPYALFSSLNHERTHLAVQYRNVAATHATPWNSKAYVILCPRDAMILNVLMERQAFAVQRVLEDLARGVDDGDFDSENMPTHADLQSALHVYTKAIDWHVKWDTDEAFVRHYRDQAQGFFTGHHAKYLKRSDITYARLGIEDLRAINDFLGLNTFGNSDEELQQLLNESFEGYQLKNLAEQNEDLGVPAYHSLPTMTDALAGRGMTPQDFIRLSLGPFSKTVQNRTERDMPSPPMGDSMILPKGLTSDPSPEYA